MFLENNLILCSVWSPLINKKMSDSLHHSSKADKEREKKIRKSSLKAALWSFATQSTRATWAQFHWGVQLQQDCSESPRWPPKSFRGTFVPRTGWGCFTQHMRDTLGVLKCVLGFFPNLICHNKMTVGTYFSIPHEVWNPKSSKELLWQLPRYLRASSASFQALLEPRSSTTGIFCRTFPPCALSQAKEEGDKNPLMRSFIYSIFQILLKISPFEQL